MFVVQVFAVCLLLIAVNGLFVAAEFATVSVRRGRIRAAAEGGSSMARRLLPILEDPHGLDIYIAACQVGITISSLVLGAYGQANLSDLLVPIFAGLGGLQTVAAESTSAVVILITLTVSQMVLGELVPKSLALQFPTPVSLAVVVPMQISMKILTPFIRVLNGSGWVLLRAMGVEPGGHRHIHSPSEIQYLVAESRRGGVLGPVEQRRLQQALAMGSRRVRELMVPRTEMSILPAAETVEDALARTADLPYTRYPVYRATPDGIVGYVHTRDLVSARIKGRGDRAIETLVRPMLGVPDELTADRLLARMREHRAVMALVVDEYGGVDGLITIHDLLTELLGELADESWSDEPGPEQLPDGRMRLPGRASVREAEEWTGLRWADGDSGTVNGVVMSLLGRLPVPGDTVLVDDAEVLVEAVDEMVATSVLVRLDSTEGGRS